MRPRSKRSSDLSPAARVWGVVLILVSLVLVVAAERDIQRRPGDQTRGSRRIWRLVSLNACGALGYFRWGRRDAS